MSNEMKSDIKLIRESQIRMEEDVRHHIRRTDAIEELVKPMHRVYIAAKYGFIFLAFIASLCFTIKKLRAVEYTLKFTHVNEIVNHIEKVSGCDMRITSGYRTIGKNLEVGGSAHSQHLYDLARDIKPKDSACISLDDIALITRIAGRRAYVYKTHVHIDMRKNIL